MSGPFLGTIFALGMANYAYHAFRFAVRSVCKMATYMRSFSNGRKYLNPRSSSGQTYTAVIYGASTKVGKAFAHHLAKRGFNLIIIERDANQLNHLEVNLNADLIETPKITKVVVDKFDQDSLWKALGGNQQVRAH